MDFDAIYLQTILMMDSTLRLATPLIFAALAGIFSERAGIIDIGLEGKMLIGACAAASVAALLSDPNLVFGITLYLAGSDALLHDLNVYPEFAQHIKSRVADISSLTTQPKEGTFLVSIFSAEQMYFLLRHMAPFWGLCAAVICSVMLALLHGFACITHKGNQITSGVAINILAAGLAPTAAHAIFRFNGMTPTLDEAGRFDSIDLPFQDIIGEIPLVGSLYVETISGHNFFVYLAILAVPFSYWLLYRTRLGLRLRASGECPEAVDTAGISVSKMRYKAVIICGTLCGFAGAYLSSAQGASFVRDMTAGKGFLALAALVFGKWKPTLALWACLVFAFADATQARLQGVSLPYVGEVPAQAIEVLPYLLTVLLLAGFVGKATAPKAIGKPYSKER